MPWRIWLTWPAEDDKPDEPRRETFDDERKAKRRCALLNTDPKERRSLRSNFEVRRE